MGAEVVALFAADAEDVAVSDETTDCDGVADATELCVVVGVGTVPRAYNLQSPEPT